MKGGSFEHRVPLSKQALDALAEARELDDDSGLIFPSPLRRGQELSWQALLKVLRTNGIDSTAHGFRTSLRQWLLECSGARGRSQRPALRTPSATASSAPTCDRRTCSTSGAR